MNDDGVEKLQDNKTKDCPLPDLVRQEYKRYKRKKPIPDFSEVIDFNEITQFKDKVEQVIVNSNSIDACTVGLIPISQWQVYRLKTCEGFMFIKNPFSPAAQKYWTHKALTEYTKKPYPCNLDVHMKLDEDKTVWEISKK